MDTTAIAAASSDTGTRLPPDLATPPGGLILTLPLRPRTRGLHTLSYWALVAVTLMLPFEITRFPVVGLRFLYITNLKLGLYLLAALALITFASPLWQSLRSRSWDYEPALGQLQAQRWALALFGLVFAASLVSSLLSTQRVEGLKWTFDLAVGACLWLAIPLWLVEDREAKLRILVVALVTGASIAALVGIIEMRLGLSFDRHLLWFKAKPTFAGPYLRLSGTFPYANIAAMYFELALPFALAGGIRCIRRRERVYKIAGWLLATDLLLVALVLTSSRGALLGLLVAVAVMVAVIGWRQVVAGLRSRAAALVAVNLVIMVAMAGASSSRLLALRSSSQSDQSWYRASYASTLPSHLRARERVVASVLIHNQGSLEWTSKGTHPFYLGYHWLDSSGHMALFEGLRSPLPRTIRPDGQMAVPASLTTPCTAGRYQLVWDLVQERIAWFSLKSASYHALPVTVGAARPGSAACLRDPRGTPVPHQLPTTPGQPSRSLLWAAATRMIASRPLLGVGPNAFRLRYGEFARPRLTQWDTGVYANSLFFELFADLGLIGGLLISAFFVVASWPFVRRLRVMRGNSIWDIAIAGSLAAFLGHGVVDYILGAHSIFIAFWILLGLTSLAGIGSTSRAPGPREKVGAC